MVTTVGFATPFASQGYRVLKPLFGQHTFLLFLKPDNGKATCFYRIAAVMNNNVNISINAINMKTFLTFKIYLLATYTFSDPNIE